MGSCCCKHKNDFQSDLENPIMKNENFSEDAIKNPLFMEKYFITIKTAKELRKKIDGERLRQCNK